MSNWRSFEQNCTDYLNNVFGRYAHFIRRGDKNSTVSDIEVTTNTGKHFYIEAKYCPAQCGQFVLLPDIETKKFEYSSANTTKLNCYSTLIINYMNDSFDEFNDSGTAGKKILFTDCTAVFAAWIVQTYKEKGVSFIIANENTIFPVEKIISFFDISAKYRVKRSGSSKVGKANICFVSQHLKNNYPIKKIWDENGKLFLISTNQLHNMKFVISGIEYMISKRDRCYEVRKLSNTFNANVIFSITMKSEVCGLNNHEFSSFLI